MKYILLFVVLAISLKIYIQIAKRFNIVDRPNSRSSHNKVTVRGGGIIFPISALCWFIYSGFQFPWFFTGLIIISMISYFDDLTQVSSQLRLVVHCCALLLLFTELEMLKMPWWSWIPLLIISAGAINSYNFMDGINGITGGYSLSVLSGIWIVNNYQVEFISNELIYFILISIVVFSYFNFRANAKCFAGDVGSISIAFIVVFLLAKLIIQSGNWLYILFLSIYGVDSVLTIIHRIIQKENIFVAHRKHLYQLLVNELKITHLRVTSIYSILQFVICLIIFFVLGRKASSINILITGGIILCILLFIFQLSRSLIYEKVNGQKETNYFLDKSV